MGGGHSVFTEEELEEYKELTYLSEHEVYHAYEKFSALAPQLIKADRDARIPKHLLLRLPQLKINPFRHRMCRWFSKGQIVFIRERKSLLF